MQWPSHMRKDAATQNERRHEGRSRRREGAGTEASRWGPRGSSNRKKSGAAKDEDTGERHGASRSQAWAPKGGKGSGGRKGGKEGGRGRGKGRYQPYAPREQQPWEDDPLPDEAPAPPARTAASSSSTERYPSFPRDDLPISPTDQTHLVSSDSASGGLGSEVTEWGSPGYPWGIPEDRDSSDDHESGGGMRHGTQMVARLRVHRCGMSPTRLVGARSRPHRDPT